MKSLTAIFLALIACASYGASVDPFAVRVQCEVDQDTTMQPAALRTLRWIQGSTPLIELDAINAGRQATTIGTSTVARMIIGPSVTGSYFAVATNYSVTNGAFLVQWPTIGTNTGTNIWFYTVFFARAGRTYWTGNGKLTIQATTSTDPDGLTWQQVGSGSWSDVVARAAATTASNSAAQALALAQQAAGGTLAVSGRVDQLGAAIAILGPATTNAGVDATNALAIARAAYTAATNAQAVAFSAMLLAQGKVSGTDWSNMLAAVSTTGTWYYSESAGAITVSNGLVRLGITADSLVFSQVTNTVNVYVSAVSSTNQAAYNGPAERTQWTMLSEDAFGVFYNTSAGFDLVYDKQLILWQVYPHEDYNTRWEPITTTSLFVCPTVLIGSDTSLGLLTLSWASATNTITIPMSTLASENLLAVDSLAYTDIGPWVSGSATNGSAALATLGFYAGYAWAGLYTQYTNGQQGRVFAASIAAPSFRDAKLAGFRFLFRGYNIADSVDVLIYDAGASAAWYTNTLNVDTSEVVHVYSVSGFNRAAAPGMTLQATVKTTAETTAGTWTALPRVEATWTK